ncbi:accessory gene regulator B family protein [Aneurinibacillus aneurinilyticus]|uniref:accessory gene regulator ArgB-like protein n=1 Tax=Aneurinibacillus aneurinilyticus TaxID=1391 RepID=UPI002E1E37DD|nr:accessory gene regulator B family protein [Aneurinibacillus aneurinilyticus]MED0668930.1 accessory gene regulator B family protein [Aneurinibacillus aneurinilyticus]
MKKLAYHLATLLKNNSGHPASIAVIQFGIEGFLNTLVTTFVLILASIITGQSITVLFLVLGFSGLRMFTGGAHLKSSLGCTIVSVSMLIGCSYIPVSFWSSLLFCLLALIIIELYSYYIEPYQSSRPLKYKHRFKLLARLWIGLGLLASFFEMSQPFAVGLLLQSLSVMPIGIHFVHGLNRLFAKGGESVS